MPRTIDADALTSVLEKWEEQACDGTENDGSDGTTRVLHPVPTTTREVIDLIADQPTINPALQWIPVTERLPKEWAEVLVWSRCGFHETAVYLGIPGKWRITWNHALLEEGTVTHWMPLPKPPMDGGDN